MLFTNLIKDKLKPIEPLPTGLKPRLGPDRFRAMVFDIYGTLLVSSSGDIRRIMISPENMEEALSLAGISIRASGKNEKEKILDILLEDLIDSVVQTREELIREGTFFPEINILEHWNIILDKASRNGWLNGTNRKAELTAAFIFEMLSNSVYPMPGMLEVLQKLKQSNVVLGIISNAQFYTPLVMNYFLEGIAGEDLRFFDPDLVVYSYRLKKAKPDQALFIPVKEKLLEKYGITARETLFIGNDMLKDIYPAYTAGFKTALFAADERSLRLREDNELIDGLQPDNIITELHQLLNLIENGNNTP
jgi:putative hydrolase of the HAD superfamily